MMWSTALFVLAAAVLAGRAPHRELSRLDRSPPRRHRHTMHLAIVGLLALAVAALLGPRAVGWAVAVGLLGATMWWVASGTVTERQRVRAREETARAVRTLALLLQAGHVPGRALEEAASDCTVLETASLTGQLGGDVAAALQDAGAMPGRHGLTRAAAAWRVSERTGAPIAAVLTRVAENLRQEKHLAGVVSAELAAARASGRIMALLPFVAVGVGTVVGADPLKFLFGSWPGEVALLSGTVLAATGVIWTEKISRSATHFRGGG